MANNVRDRVPRLWRKQYQLSVTGLFACTCMAGVCCRLIGFVPDIGDLHLPVRGCRLQRGVEAALTVFARHNTTAVEVADALAARNIDEMMGALIPPELDVAGGYQKQNKKGTLSYELPGEMGFTVPNTLEELRALEREVEREWWWLYGALNAVAKVQADRQRGSLGGFRQMQAQVREVDRRRVAIAVRIAEMDAQERRRSGASNA